MKRRINPSTFVKVIHDFLAKIYYILHLVFGRDNETLRNGKQIKQHVYRRQLEIPLSLPLR